MQRFQASLDDPLARVAFATIARTATARARDSFAEIHRQQALTLARSVGMGVHEDGAEIAFNWDGTHLRADTEAFVLIHEVAHYQLATPERRRLIDFGLGPGPDTRDRAAAAAVAVLSAVEGDREEAMTSLLGILWEAALGHPALASFLDQNWLEGAETSRAARHFEAVLRDLVANGFVDRAGRPIGMRD